MSCALLRLSAVIMMCIACWHPLVENCYRPIDIYMNNRPSVDMSITFKDTKNAMYIMYRFYFVKQRVQNAGQPIVWISNQSMVADGMSKVLSKKDLLHKIQYMLNSIDRY
jgi:hypothetical protein